MDGTLNTIIGILAGSKDAVVIASMVYLVVTQKHQKELILGVKDNLAKVWSQIDHLKSCK